jgi:hypothetical protein
MTADFTLVPNRDGLWLLRVGRRCYMVAPALGRRLIGLGGCCHESLVQSRFSPSELAVLHPLLAGDRVGAPKATGRRLIWIRLPFLPARLVNACARRLRRATTFPVLGWQLAVAAAAYVAGTHVCRAAYADSLERCSLSAPLVLAAFLATAVWHEIGHAAALKREGRAAGVVGLGMLLLVPVLYCDVTAVALLPRRGRLRVDASGLVFQLAGGGFLFALSGVLVSWAPRVALSFQVAGLLALLAVVWSLIPFMRTDGYWLLCDLLGCDDLDSPLDPAGMFPDGAGAPRDGDGTPPDVAAAPPAPADSSARLRIKALAGLLVVYRLLNGLFLVSVCLWLPWRILSRFHLLRWLGGQDGWRRAAAAIAAVVAAGLVMKAWIAVTRRCRDMGRAIASDCRLLARIVHEEAGPGSPDRR